HMNSRTSEGKYSIPEIIDIARANDIKVIVITDRDTMKWEYGLWPFANVVKRTIEQVSVFKYGVKRYLDQIRTANKENPDMVLIPGVESAPFYYWQGSVFSNSLRIINWHKHILAIGMEKESDYKHLPVIGNKQGLMLPLRAKNIFSFVIPLLIFLIAILCLRKWWMIHKYYRFLKNGAYGLLWKIYGISFFVVGLVLLLHNYPFRDFKFNQYQNNLGVMPYQNFIDYVGRHGGLTFWAHPEAEYFQTIGNIKIETFEHSQDLLNVKDYTGFAVFYEGFNRSGNIGGIWDEALKQYCQGKRGTPVWAIGGLAFDITGDLDAYMKDLRNILLVPRLDKNEALAALGRGRMYVLRGRDSSCFILDKFMLRDVASGLTETMGGCLQAQGAVEIQMSGHFLTAREKSLKIKLIKNGTVVKTFDVNSPFNILYNDEVLGKDGMSYYRLEINSSDLTVITNPIFIRRK
ncbi:MAG: hypothetical protein PHG51_05700, partial [Candidatus Omnitrophica bacterium]|nr:hypothetical protein [Candidatus Omnitrophota bacterium]